jgi:hypothetical protein
MTVVLLEGLGISLQTVWAMDIKLCRWFGGPHRRRLRFQRE